MTLSPPLRPAKQPRLNSPGSTSTTTSTASVSMSAPTPTSSSSSFLVQLDAAHPGACLPTRGSALAAGYDLYSSETLTLPARGGRKVVQTGIRIKVPQGTYGRVAPRSGLAVKHGIDVGAGVVDEDYRGLLGVLLFNFGEEDFTINQGDRIAQLVLEKIATPAVVQVESLEATERGEGGFGHTGGFGAKVVQVQEPKEASSK
ncbi:dUTP diphosphatase [Microstroma glucosiphilum]|uniref:Deoxyuridine 5'-triphosphate nucleotidohydrolase n=1 Tax=Pseudomicrostroma glucosiphilum TaxID=1684307 RepID=A0A316U1C2_9BASI|nr:dUTP diphosphatase [Pseudomicrostroma glucosiphilum]PWN18654.1 dUTP diphosphatase [Pseudomicrostroma glucosiphilum]